MASAAATVNTSFVWQQGLIRALRGHLQMPEEEFMVTLRKIIAARQEGKFPWAEENSELCEDKNMQEKVWKNYQALKAPSVLSERVSLLKNLFFTTVADTTLCDLTPEQVKTAQENYLPKMFDGVKKAMLEEDEQQDHPQTEAWFEELASDQIAQDWFKDFAIASYSKVIDALDKLFEGLSDDFRKSIEIATTNVAKQYIMKASSEDLKRLIYTIKLDKLHGTEDVSIEPIIEGPLWEAYVNYRDLAGGFAPEKQEAFWKARVISLETYVRRLETQ